MQWRVLPEAEYPRLTASGSPIGGILDTLPAGSRVLVVEDEQGTIVGSWAAIPYLHVEGVWVAPQSRKRGAVARRLLQGMAETVADMGHAAVWTSVAANDAETKALIEGLRGIPMPGEHFAVAL